MANDPNTEPYRPDGGTPPTAAEIGGDMETARREVAAAANDLKHEAEAQAGELKAAAQGQIEEAQARAKSFATERKADAADRLDHVSGAVRRVADDLGEASETAAVAGYARDLAGSIARFSETIRDNSVDDLVGMAEDFGRRRPLMLLGAAALAGFAASRFALASAERRNGTAPLREDAAMSTPRPMDEMGGNMRNTRQGGALR